MSKELRLIKETFCRLHKLPTSTELTLVKQGQNAATLNTVFLVTGPGFPGVRYEHERISLTPYTQIKKLSLGAEFKDNPSLINKDSIAAWVNRTINVGLLPSDIGQLIMGDRVTVISAANSMRFKHSFSMAF